MSVITTRIEIHASLERCFDLARSVDAHVASSDLIDGRAIAGRTTGLSELGDQTTWSARFFGVRFQLVTEIMEFVRPDSFEDVMKKGLFRRFGHRYTFQVLAENQTLMIDELTFESPYGVLGRLFDHKILGPRMQRLLNHRLEYLKRVAEKATVSEAGDLS